MTIFFIERDGKLIRVTSGYHEKEYDSLKDIPAKDIWQWITEATDGVVIYDCSKRKYFVTFLGSNEYFRSPDLVEVVRIKNSDLVLDITSEEKYYALEYHAREKGISENKLEQLCQEHGGDVDVVAKILNISVDLDFEVFEAFWEEEAYFPEDWEEQEEAGWSEDEEVF